MKFLVIGLGSMGKRRIRCLQYLNEKNIYGFDICEDRRKEVEEKYNITTFNSFSAAIEEVKPEAIIVSVPPDQHMEYIKFAISNDTHFFVEASVVDEGMSSAITALKEKNIVAAPSSTLMFHPAIKLIKNIVESGELGKLSNVILHSGQYLPDWHTYEKVSDYYVSNTTTGGGREIVPFELTWFTEVFGYPKRLCANYRKTIEIKGAEYIDDTYNCLLDYGSYLAVVTVDVVSRYATRRLTINGSEKQLYWSWEENAVKVYDPEKMVWEKRTYEMKNAETGYNVNIGENMYIDEIKNYIDAINFKKPFINSMEKDHRILKLLYSVERADNVSQYQEVRF